MSAHCQLSSLEHATLVEHQLLHLQSNIHIWKSRSKDVLSSCGFAFEPFLKSKFHLLVHM